MDASPSRRRLAIEAILFLSYAAFSMSWMAVSPLATQLMAWFGATKAEFALLNTAVTVNKVVAPLVAGAVAVRLGVKNTILLGALFVTSAVVGPLFPSFTAFLVSRAFFGIGGAVLVTLMPAMVIQWFPKTELAVVNGINGVAANTGFAIAMSLTVPLSATAMGWKGTLLAYSAVSVVLLVLWALIASDRAAKPVEKSATVEKPAQSETYFGVWRMRETWLIAGAFTAQVALYLTFSLWLPTYYQEQFKLAPAEAASYTSLLLYTGIPTAILAGLASQKLGLRRPFLMAGGALAGVAAFGTFLSPEPAIIAVSAVLLGIGLFTPTAALMTILMELPGVTPRHVALISGTMISFCYILNSIIPNIVGWASDRLGSFVIPFVVLSACSWIVVIAGALLPETGPRHKLSLNPITKE